MIDFSTDALLYPLTKGDVSGHAFHGNQYQTVAGSGENPRPPRGTFQLSPQELTAFGARLHKLWYEEGQNVGRSTNQSRAFDQASVEVAKLLGMDKPATRVSTIENPELYRGCDKAGAESLLGGLERFGATGGIAFGNGIYFSPNLADASEYSQGAVVSASIDPSANLAEYKDIERAFNGKDTYYLGNLLSGETLTAFEAMSPQEKTALNSYASMPTNAALLLGYQGFHTQSRNVTTIIDRSVLKVAF
jgi:hypothetical protein